MEFSRQEYWSGLPFPSPEDLPNPGIEPWSPASQADSLLCPLFYYTVNLFFAVPCQLLSPPLVACACSVVSNSLQPHARWTVAHQTPLPVKFSRQECWSELSFLSPGELSDPRIKPESLVSPALAGGFFTTAPPGKPSSPVSPRKNFSSPPPPSYFPLPLPLPPFPSPPLPLLLLSSSLLKHL